MEKTISAYTIPYTEQWEMESETGRLYRISMFVPNAPIPEEGFPVMYVLDGNAIFSSVVEAARLQSYASEAAEPAVIVGIGYPTDEPYDYAARSWDYTSADSKKGAGGADAFLYFLERDLKPSVESKTSINIGKAGLFGHGLGGLFTLYALLHKPELFDTYIAGSPEIGRDNRHLVSLEEDLYNQLREWEEVGNLQFKSLLLGVGAAEDADVIEEVRQMHIRLFDWQLSNFEVDLRIFLEEGHITMLHPLISRGMAHFLQ
ncbi:alpha/beta hydrolase-fold protein [Aciduricibacillus chroicocephali]|uniref:Alpha/beta hydrolase-fold protein n=1 Tax=Aciduricibacillus chroicocephali TaxID=3054939 RepID=A0ABY9KUK2_9BACI|nr:alpha/beta hydrolase-fold protein [Bacillaceae bacterium 44XB]